MGSPPPPPALWRLCRWRLQPPLPPPRAAALALPFALAFSIDSASPFVAVLRTCSKRPSSFSDTDAIGLEGGVAGGILG